jgi:hypothetical protein
VSGEQATTLAALERRLAAAETEEERARIRELMRELAQAPAKQAETR